MRNLTLDERERLAYANGDTAALALLAHALDGDDDLLAEIEDLKADNHRLSGEMDDLAADVDTLTEQNMQLRDRVHDLENPE